ncbi:PAS domain S-box protein [Mycolicibacterium hodleri]|uniref:PAS domain S-box protein n=1 Tax=Mycolicibacterium hodleri TaxID=49897 RepID=A0A502DVH5_9MYCO|nr:PAS domain S-box protein [Mycolicibacterium hodleri]TPG29495.1 PAS domain S-box protein [Mycolicibacterium hodleri]
MVGGYADDCESDRRSSFAEAMSPVEELRRLRLLLNRLPALIGYWNRDMRNVIANDAYLEYFGITPSEARGRHIRDILGEAVYELNLPYILKALAGEEQLFERTLIDSAGMTRYTQASYVPDIVDGEVRGFYVQVTDVTARVEAEQERDEARRLFQISMTNAPFGEAVLTRSAHILRINPALCALLGYAAEDLVGNDFRDLVHPDDRPSADAELARLQNNSQVASERRYVRRDGTSIWMQRNAVLVAGGHGGDDVIVAQFLDVTARRRAEAELAQLALTDSLTGLQNRHALNECMAQFCGAEPKATIGVVFADLDGFKSVNDTFGHATGDAVLVAAAGRLAKLVTPPNSAYRVGGDEFVVLVPDANTDGEVAALAGGVRAALTGTYSTTQPVATRRRVALTATVGWTRGGTADAEGLLRRADANMYQQKPAPRTDAESRSDADGIALP